MSARSNATANGAKVALFPAISTVPVPPVERMEQAATR